MTMRKIKVAICGELPTAYNFLLKLGVVNIDRYLYATEMADESQYHLILVYAPNAEGIFNTVYRPGSVTADGGPHVPIRLLNEPCCHSALLELKSLIRRISRSLEENPKPKTISTDLEDTEGGS